jgi:alkyl sulfatase BDS1-like metallo-beta-lactamase superfamily hydrolase
VSCHAVGVALEVRMLRRQDRGTSGLIEPSRYVTKDFEEATIDGVRMVFQSTPGTEEPAEMNTWFPQFKAARAESR